MSRLFLLVLLMALAALPAAAQDDMARETWTESVSWYRDGNTLTLVGADGQTIVTDVVLVLPNADYASFQTMEGLWGVIGGDGRIRLPPRQKRLHELGADQALLVACLADDRDCGLFDLHGEQILPQRYINFGSNTGHDPWVVTGARGDGLFDTVSRRWLLPPRFASLQQDCGFVLTREQTDGAVTVRDARGRPIVGIPEADDWRLWRQGKRVVGAQGMYDVHGAAKVPPGRYLHMDNHGEHLRVVTEAGSGLIDAEGRELVAPGTYAIHDLLVNWLPVTDTQGRRGLLEPDGRIAVPAHWDDIQIDLVEDPATRQNVPVIRVFRNGLQGVVDSNGRELFPPRFDHIQSPDFRDGHYLVSENGRLGICDFFRGTCPIPPGYTRIERIDDRMAGHALFVVEADGLAGLRDLAGREVLAPRLAGIGAVARRAGMTLLLAARDPGGRRHVIELHFGPGGWQVSDENRERPAALHQPYDGNVMAMAGHEIQARYLPAEIPDENGIRAAFAEGRLLEPAAPSLQLAGDVAFERLSLLAHSDYPPAEGRMTVCPEPDGFRLLPWGNIGPRRCTEADSHALRFRIQDDGNVHCLDCPSHALPGRWVRRDMASQCPLPVIRPEQARAEFDAWRARFRADLAGVVQDEDPHRWLTLPAAMAASVAPGSTAANALALTGIYHTSALDTDDSEVNRRRKNALGHLLELLESASSVTSEGAMPDQDALGEYMCSEVWAVHLPVDPTSGRPEARRPQPRGVDEPAMARASQQQAPDDGHPTHLRFVRGPDGLLLAGLPHVLLGVLGAL